MVWLDKTISMIKLIALDTPVYASQPTDVSTLVSPTVGLLWACRKTTLELSFSAYASSCTYI